MKLFVRHVDCHRLQIISFQSNTNILGRQHYNYIAVTLIQLTCKYTLLSMRGISQNISLKLSRVNILGAFVNCRNKICNINKNICKELKIQEGKHDIHVHVVAKVAYQTILLCNCKWHFQSFFNVIVCPSWHLLHSVY